MIINGITMDEFNEIVSSVSTGAYAGNVIVHPDSRPTSATGTRLQARLRAVTSIGEGSPRALAPGARRGHTGRRIPSACWHAYRDVLTKLFELNPDAKVYTAHAKYLGKDSFNYLFEATGNANIGSAYQPMCYADACDCE